MDLALNNPQRLIFHKTQPTKQYNTPNQSGPESDGKLRVSLHFPKLQYYWSLTIRSFNVINRTFVFWGGSLTPLPRCWLIVLGEFKKWIQNCRKMGSRPKYATWIALTRPNLITVHVFVCSKGRWQLKKRVSVRNIIRPRENFWIIYCSLEGMHTFTERGRKR